MWFINNITLRTGVIIPYEIGAPEFNLDQIEFSDEDLIRATYSDYSYPNQFKDLLENAETKCLIAESSGLNGEVTVEVSGFDNESIQEFGVCFWYFNEYNKNEFNSESPIREDKLLSSIVQEDEEYIRNILYLTEYDRSTDYDLPDVITLVETEYVSEKESSTITKSRTTIRSIEVVGIPFVLYKEWFILGFLIWIVLGFIWIKTK